MNSATRDIIRRLQSTEQQQVIPAALEVAAQRARHLQRPILASVTLPIAPFDAVHAFSASRLTGLGECFMWEQATSRLALVGAGIAHTVEIHEQNRFPVAADAWRELLADAAIVTEVPTFNNPLLFGGFSFDPSRPRTSLWSAFPSGLLILPLLLLRQQGLTATLTLNRMITPDDEPALCAAEMIEYATQLLEAIDDTFLATPEEVAYKMTLQDSLPASSWMKLIERTTRHIRNGEYEKVVFARSVQVMPDEEIGAFNISATLLRLRASYPNAYVFALQRGGRFFLGATPERLVKVQQGQLHTVALAGTARRGNTAQEDMHIGEELLLSTKNMQEHAIVVERIRESLADHCTEIDTSATPRLLRLKNVQHLETPIVATMRPGHTMLDVMAQLHPTPAVGGFPREKALMLIRKTERLDRGWYAGPLGWIGADGDGEFVVALRSGLIERERATLFAGCGIVADSDPQSEYIETCLKLQAMLRGLGAPASI